MFTLHSSLSFYFYRSPCDMRKSFNGLSGLVRNELGKEPAGGDVFVFLNRTRTHLKLLHWERGGFVLYYKRLEQGTFILPAFRNGESRISWSQLVLMIEGIVVQKSVQKLRYPH